MLVKYSFHNNEIMKKKLNCLIKILLNYKRNYRFCHKDVRQYEYKLNKYYE